MTPLMVDHTSDVAVERSVVERSIGKMKRSFDILHSSFRFDLSEKTEMIVYVCAFLSNYVKKIE